MFGEMSGKTVEQRDEPQCLRAQLSDANQQLEKSQSQPLDMLSEFVANKKALRERENDEMMRQMQQILKANVLQQHWRLEMVKTNSAQLRTAQ